MAKKPATPAKPAKANAGKPRKRQPFVAYELRGLDKPGASQ